jgi:plasmid stabilization system protein ParE
MPLLFAPLAQADLEEIGDYIARQSIASAILYSRTALTMPRNSC